MTEQNNQSQFSDQERDELLNALSGVLSSDTFQRSPGLAKLLDYLAQNALEGQASKVTEYAIAQDVLSKGSDFDPKVDPIVRVRIKRLRDALEKFYLDNPAPNRLAVPAGGYDLKITKDTNVSKLRVKPAYFLILLAPIIAATIWWLIPVNKPDVADSYPLIEVVPFQNLTGDVNNARLIDGLVRQIVTDLQGFGRVRVYQFEPNSIEVLRPDYRLTGSVLSVEDQLDLSFRLDRVAGQVLVYGKRMQGSILGDNYFEAIADVSRRMSGEVGSKSGPTFYLPFGTGIDDREVSEGTGIPISVFECTTKEAEFFVNYSTTQLIEALNCFESLERSFGDDPTAASSYWNLRFHSVPEFNLMNTSSLPLEHRSNPDEVLENAQRIVSENPQSSDGYLLLGSVQLALRQFIAAEISIRQSIQINPGDPVGYAVLSYILITGGDANNARKAGEEALRLSVQPQGWVYLPLFLATLVLGDDEAAISIGNTYLATRSDMSANFVGLIVARLDADEISEEAFLASLMNGERPFEGYGSFIKSEAVRTALAGIVPEIMILQDDIAAPSE